MARDASEGGCFINSLHPLPSPGRPLVLKIDVPDERWICLKAQVVYTKPEFGFAVSFVDVPADARLLGCDAASCGYVACCPSLRQIK
jgi:PilZ domain